MSFHSSIRSEAKFVDNPAFDIEQFDNLKFQKSSQQNTVRNTTKMKNCRESYRAPQ